MTSSNPDPRPKVPSPNTVTLRFRASTQELWGDTIQSIAIVTYQTLQFLRELHESGVLAANSEMWVVTELGRGANWKGTVNNVGRREVGLHRL